MKTIDFLSTSLNDLRAFPPSVSRQLGYELDRIHNGFGPDDFKPMPIAGKWVTELTLGGAARSFRVMYMARFQTALYVLHCFQKKTQRTPKEEIEAAKQYKDLFKGDQDMKSQKFASVWDAIEDTPQAAASMKARSSLMMELARMIETQDITQAEAAELFGVTQPRASDLMRGKINLFSLDMLMNMAATAGMAPVVKLSKPKGLPVRRAVRAGRARAVAATA